MAITLTDVNTGDPIVIDKNDVASFYDIDLLFRRINMNDGKIYDGDKHRFRGCATIIAKNIFFCKSLVLLQLGSKANFFLKLFYFLFGGSHIIPYICDVIETQSTIFGAKR
jgi:hypothetical protein